MKAAAGLVERCKAHSEGHDAWIMRVAPLARLFESVDPSSESRAMKLLSNGPAKKTRSGSIGLAFGKRVTVTIEAEAESADDARR